MKSKAHPICLFVLLAASPAIFGQGILIDQQSTNLIEGVAGLQSGQPLGQSFTPTLSSVGFVALTLYDAGSLPIGATVYVNLRSSSITGPILSSTTPIFMPNDFFGVTNFLFSVPVTVTPGVTYFFEPIALPGSDGWASYVTDGSYARGSIIFQGTAVPGYNLWFQEGIVVPEPTSVTLIVVGSGLVALYRRKRNFK